MHKQINNTVEDTTTITLGAQQLLKMFEEATIAKYLEKITGPSEKSEQYEKLQNELFRRLSIGNNVPLEDVINDIYPQFGAPLKNVRAAMIAMFLRKGLITPEEFDEVLRCARYLDVEIDDYD